jgi:hypothetical protein
VHARSADPFGDVIHYADARTAAPVERIAADVKDFLAANGFADASIETLAPTVEDSFIAQTESAA